MLARQRIKDRSRPNPYFARTGTSFSEAERARVFADELDNWTLRPVTDAIGNVIAPFETSAPNPVVIGAHLDTVFPASTPLEIRRHGRVLYLPGIADNGSGIVALLWVLRVATRNGYAIPRPLIAIGNVGEEGKETCVAIRHLFNAPPWEGRGLRLHRDRRRRRAPHHASGSGQPSIANCMTGPEVIVGPTSANRIRLTRYLPRCITSPRPALRRPATSFNIGVIRGGIIRKRDSGGSTRGNRPSFHRVDNLDDMETHLRNVVADVGSVRSGVRGLNSWASVPAERPPCRRNRAGSAGGDAAFRCRSATRRRIDGCEHSNFDGYFGDCCGCGWRTVTCTPSMNGSTRPIDRRPATTPRARRWSSRSGFVKSRSLADRI